VCSFLLLRVGECLTYIYFTVRTLIDCFSEIPGSEKTQAEVLQDNIEWAKKEKRIFLKQSLEARLITLCVYLDTYR
jgi:26S proteasome regulatory subunit N6